MTNQQSTNALIQFYIIQFNWNYCYDCLLVRQKKKIVCIPIH